MKNKRSKEVIDIISGRITARRLALGMSKAELSRRSGLALETINMVEFGRREPYISTSKQIADALNISLDYLVGLSDDKEIRREIE